MSASAKKLRVGVIGCGKISVMHLVPLSRMADVTVAACCDIDKTKAEKAAKKYGGRAYTSYEEMIDTEKPDAVHICLPHYLHTKAAEYAFSRGVHVLSEKPMDVSLAAAEHAVSAAKAAGVQYGVIFQCRCNNSSRLVKNAVESGRLGKILSARSVLTWSRPDSYYAESDWKGTWDKEGGGVVIDQAIHSIDLVNWIVDSEVESVDCTMANHGHRTVNVEDSAQGLVTYKNGVKYGFYCMNNYGYDEPIEIRLYCEKGKAVFGYDDACILYDDGTSEEAHQDDGTAAYENADNFWGFQHARQIRQFYNAVLGKEPLVQSGEEALKTHRLIMEMYEKGGMRK